MTKETESHNESELPEFNITFASQSGWIFSQKGTLQIAGVPLLYEKEGIEATCDITFGTRVVNFDGVAKPAAKGIYAMVVGRAPNMQRAHDTFIVAADGVGSLIALLTNSGFDPWHPSHGFESTDGSSNRVFFTTKPRNEPILPIARRHVPREHVGRYYNALEANENTSRIRTAISQYLEALRQWRPGAEIMALAHCYMAIEAITPILRKQELARNNFRKNWELARHWGIAVPDEQTLPDSTYIQKLVKRIIHAIRDVNPRGWPYRLDSELRRRNIFAGDEETYSAAKNAFTGLKHGHYSIGEVERLANFARDKTAMYLRSAILELLTPGDITADLLQYPYDLPHCLAYYQALSGNIVGEGTMKYSAPMKVTWTSTLQELESGDSEYARIHEQGNLNLQIPAGRELVNVTSQIQKFNQDQPPPDTGPEVPSS